MTGSPSNPGRFTCANSWDQRPAPSHLPAERDRTGRPEQARREVATFIDNYNHRRRHSSCEMMPPVAYQQVLDERAAEPAGKERAA